MSVPFAHLPAAELANPWAPQAASSFVPQQQVQYTTAQLPQHYGTQPQYLMEQPPMQYMYSQQAEQPGHMQQVQYLPQGYEHAQGQQQHQHLVYESPPPQYVTYEAQPQQQYVEYLPAEAAGQPQYMVMPDGQLVQMAPQEQGQQPQQEYVTYESAPPAYQQQPAEVYNISPQQFARLAQGGQLSNMEMAQLAGGGAPPPASPGPFGQTMMPPHGMPEWAAATQMMQQPRRFF